MALKTRPRALKDYGPLGTDKVPNEKFDEALLAYFKEQRDFVTNSDITWEVAKRFGWTGEYPQFFQDRITRRLMEWVAEKKMVKYDRSHKYPSTFNGSWTAKIGGGPYWATPEIDALGKQRVAQRKKLEEHYSHAATALFTRLVNSGCDPKTTHVESSRLGLGQVTLTAGDVEKLLGQGNKILVDAGDVVQLLSFVDYDPKSPKLAELYDRVDALLPKEGDTNAVNSQPH
jgi:hypothetical protein